MPDIDALRQTLQFEEVAKRLARGDSPRKVGRDLNERPNVLKALIRSDEFLVVLREYDRDLADDILEERNAAKPLKYEELILEEAARSVEVLRDLRDSSDDDRIIIGACTALVSVAEKIKKVHTEKVTKRVTFPKTQLDALLKASQEVDALDRHAEPSTNELTPSTPD